jgi:hypothetical protein
MEESEICYAILNQFFSQCRGIRNLNLESFDFGVDQSSIPQTINDGFYRLSQLNLRRSGNVCGVRPNFQSSIVQQ